MRYRLDPAVEVLDGGRALLGGDPTRLLRLSDAGARTVERWRVDGLEPETRAERKLVDRLLDAGMLHPQPVPAVTGTPPTVVVPVHDRVDALDRCLAALVASGAVDLVVVDDASADPDAHRAVAERHGAAFVGRGVNGGPAACRMTGWDHLAARSERPELVAFVDSDIGVTADCWPALVAHFDDPMTGLVAPRVRHVEGAGPVDRYEAANSPLDLGADPAPIMAGTRVAYVPAAALVLRAEAFAEVGGFDESLDVGEDVDLLWRLADAGWRCRYEPASTVAHAGRSSLVPMLRRRFDYGRSAAELDLRHPGALPPVRGSRWSAAVVVLAVAGHPVAAGALSAWTVREMARKLGAVPGASVLAARLVLRGHLGFARQVARAAVRPWLPLTMALSIISRRARRVAIVAALVSPVLAWRERRPAVTLPMWTALWLADDVAYTAGVWAGCIRRRTIGPLTADL